MPSCTDFEVLERRLTPDGTPAALVACHPRTGRQHQIRAHLRHAGLQLIGDKIYGPDEMVWKNLNLCKAHRITLHWEEGKAQADLE